MNESLRETEGRVNESVEEMDEASTVPIQDFQNEAQEVQKAAFEESDLESNLSRPTGRELMEKKLTEKTNAGDVTEKTEAAPIF